MQRVLQPAIYVTYVTGCTYILRHARARGAHTLFGTAVSGRSQGRVCAPHAPFYLCERHPPSGGVSCATRGRMARTPSSGRHRLLFIGTSKLQPHRHTLRPGHKLD